MSPARGTTRAALRGLPRTAWVCALIAFLNAACWSIVVPPFEGPDEFDNFAYVQQLGETGKLPPLAGGRLSPQQAAAGDDLRSEDAGYRVDNVTWNPKNRTIASMAERRRLDHNLAQPLGRVGSGAAGTATPEPPFYYAVASVPYRLGTLGTVLDELQLIRLLSALLAGLVGFFTFLFLREALPGVAWAWTVGALGAAFTPVLASSSAGVNPDALFFAVSAALFYCLARAFRRQLTPRLAVTLGVLSACGLLTKVSFIELLPGLAVGAILLARREWRGSRASIRDACALAIGPTIVPVLIFTLVNRLSGRPGLGLLSTSVSTAANRSGSTASELEYIWQLFLPRAPGMTNDFPGLDPLRQIWVRGLIGRYNWLETVFPNGVYAFALIPVCLIAVLCLRGLIDRRAALRSRAVELSVYGLMALGTLVSIGINSYLAFPAQSAAFTEPRYLLPLLPLGAAVLALAARGAGRTLGPAAGLLIVLLIVAHDGFSQLLEVARFYG